MNFKFPSFDPGTPETLLDSKWAKLVKTFVEAWNAVKVVWGDKNEFKISQKNAVLTLKAPDISELHYSSGGYTIDIDGNGIAIDAGTMRIRAGNVNEGVYVDNGNGTVYLIDGAVEASGKTTGNAGSFGGNAVYLYRSSNGKTLDIQTSALTQDMAIREIDVCDGGVAKKMLVIGSAPYT